MSVPRGEVMENGGRVVVWVGGEDMIGRWRGWCCHGGYRELITCRAQACIYTHIHVSVS